MHARTKQIDLKVIKSAYEWMSEKELLFIMGDDRSAARLVQFVQQKNRDFYQQSFELSKTPYDKDLIVAATPDLGPRQLGVFAGRSFAKGEIIAEYVGKKKWGIQSTKEMVEKIKAYAGSGDYLWQVSVNNQQSMAIDSLEKGSVARFVNDSLEPNTETVVVAETKINQGIEETEYHVYYKARMDIPLGREITVSYGDAYFNLQNPRIERQPQSLQEILYKLAEIKQLADIQVIRLDTLESVQMFTDLLGWEGNFETECELTNPDIYLDSHNYPLLFDLSQQDSIDRLKATGLDFQRTSQLKLLVAPTQARNGRLSLFVGQPVKKGHAVCTIVGEEWTKKELNSKKAEIDENFLYEIGNRFLFSKKKCSEARFLEGVDDSEKANVSLKRGTLTYSANRDIQPGEELVVFFHNYQFTAQPDHLNAVIENFNILQSTYQAELSPDFHLMITPCYPRIPTPTCPSWSDPVEHSNINEEIPVFEWPPATPNVSFNDSDEHVLFQLDEQGVKEEKPKSKEYYIKAGLKWDQAIRQGAQQGVKQDEIIRRIEKARDFFELAGELRKAAIRQVSIAKMSCLSTEWMKAADFYIQIAEQQIAARQSVEYCFTWALNCAKFRNNLHINKEQCKILQKMFSYYQRIEKLDSMVFAAYEIYKCTQNNRDLKQLAELQEEYINYMDDNDGKLKNKRRNAAAESWRQLGNCNRPEYLRRAIDLYMTNKTLAKVCHCLVELAILTKDKGDCKNALIVCEKLNYLRAKSDLLTKIEFSETSLAAIKPDQDLISKIDTIIREQQSHSRLSFQNRSDNEKRYGRAEGTKEATWSPQHFQHAPQKRSWMQDGKDYNPLVKRRQLFNS